MLSTIVQQSWKRCQESNLKAYEKANDQIISARRINEIIQENHPLVGESLPLFNKLAPFLLSTEHIALLSDRDGNIIQTIGDPVFANQAQQVQLQIGANWTEGYKGTNAIGTALIAQQPIQVQGDQHYFLENRFLTCSAAPIFSPAGELLGVIDISTRKEYSHPFALTIACMIAEALQNRFLYASAERVIALPGASSTGNGGGKLSLVGVDRDERIVGLNGAAQQQLGKEALGTRINAEQEHTGRILQDHRPRYWSAATKPKLKPFPRLAGSCPLFLQAKMLGQKAAQVDFPVIILGESGTGKELFAQMVHETGPRAHEPFIAVNCSSIPENLIESELFGYESGSFTGAHREGRIGKFEAAKKGTIFLDEIGDMSLRAQAALLRVLQEKVVTPVGSNQARPIYARIIAATHRNLPEEIKAGRFRADLYYRLKGVSIQLPPLKKRSDIAQLAEHLLQQMDAGEHYRLTAEAKEKLCGYAWPGNVRELQGVLIQAVFLAEDSLIDCEHIQLEGLAEGNSYAVPSLREAERQAIKNAVEKCGGNISKAAKLLQIGRNTLYRKLEEYQMQPISQEEP